MPSPERPRERRRSERSKSHHSRPHKDRSDHATGSIAQTVPVERPATIEDLRKARIDYIETPVAERQRRMRYEYTKVVPVKVKSIVEETKPRRESSTTSRVKSSTKRHSQSHNRTEESDRRAARQTDDAQYVYRVQSSTAQPAANTDAERISVERRQTAAGIPERRTTIRRHTAPVIRRTSENSKANVPSPPESRPPLRKSTTVAPESSSRPSIRRSSVSAHANPETSAARAVVADAKKCPSVLGGFFMARPVPVEKKVSCLTCGDETPASRTARLPCKHRMCRSCLKRVFELSINDPAHMPPRCCTDQHIDLKHVESLFDNDFRKTWNRKFKEYKAKNRIYCPRRGCGEWIQPKHVSVDRGRKIGKCPSCKTQVCGICNQKMHKSKDCPRDPATKEFVETAKKEGWQKCYSCSAMVELKEGCNHMTCRCTAEFCMVCGSKWKSCDCPWFSYDQVGILGDQIRYQEEMDRRREQERRDEELARRMEGLDVENNQGFNMFGIGNAAGHHMNANFIQQAREALTANYQQADQAARGLLNGFFIGRDNRSAGPVTPSDDETPQLLRQATTTQRTNRRLPPDPAEGPMMTPAGVPMVRRHTRRRSTLQDLADERTPTAAGREQELRIREWANNLPG